MSQVEHAKALASIPDAEAKAWAWERFTGEVEVPNYELEAIGLGLWQVGQEQLTDPYVARYFDEVLATTEVRSGRMLAVATNVFYPRWSATEETRRPGARPARPRRRRLDDPARAGRRDLGPRAPPRGATGVRPMTERAPGRDARPDGPDRRSPSTAMTETRATPGASPRGPAGHRGAARDPGRLARLPRPTGLGDDAHSRPRLRAGGRVQLSTRRSRLRRRSAGSPTAPTSTSPRSRSSTSSP